MEEAATKYLGSVAGVEVGVGVDPWLTLVVTRMARRCHRPLSWTVKVPVVDSKLKIGLIGGAVTMVEAVGELAVAVMMVVGVQQDSDVVDVVGGMAQAEPVGVDVTRVTLLFTGSVLALAYVHPLFSFSHAFQYVLQLLM